MGQRSRLLSEKYIAYSFATHLRGGMSPWSKTTENGIDRGYLAGGKPKSSKENLLFSKGTTLISIITSMQLPKNIQSSCT